MAGNDGSGGLMLVTGASGFVGSAVATAARKAGYRVRVLVRRSSPRTNIHPDDEVVIGDICDRGSLLRALQGVRYLAHAAADYRLWSPSPAEIIRTNVEGTRYLMEEALRSGVERIVYTSAVSRRSSYGRTIRQLTKIDRCRNVARSAHTRRARSSRNVSSKIW